MALRVLITDDHPVIRAGLRQILGLYPEMSVVGEAASGPDALDMIPLCQPDVLLVDISMPGMSGLELIEEVRRKHPDLPVLVLSMHREEHYAVRARLLGAAGYLCKDSDPEDLARAIRQATANLVMSDPGRAEPETAPSPPSHARLTPRELQILLMLASGQSVNEVARELALSANTVSTHKRRLMDKLGVNSNAGLVRYALAHHLIE